MINRITTRDVRLIDDGSPAESTDVLSSVLVGMGSKATLTTVEDRLTRAIRFFCMTALRTAPACIPGINKHNGDANLFCLVANVAAQLRECPRVQRGSLFASSRDPQSDVRQILQRYRLLRVLRLRNEPLRYYVIYVLSKSRLLPGELLEAALCRLRSFLLQFRPKALLTMTNTLRERAAVVRSTGRGKNIGDSHIATDNVGDIVGLWFIDITRSGKVKTPTKQDQVRFSLLGVQHFALALTAQIRNLQPAASSPNRNRLFLNVPAQNPKVVGNRTIQLVSLFGFLAELVGVGYFSDATDNYLRTEGWKLFSSFGVRKSVKLELRKDPRFPSLFTQPVTAAVRFAKRFMQRGQHTLACLELYARNQLHSSIVSRMDKNTLSV